MVGKIHALILFYFLSISCNLFAGDFEKEYYRLREKEIAKFSFELFENGEYYRAITEAKRYISILPQGKNVEEMYKLIGDSYLMAKEWIEAINAYDEILNKFPNSKYSRQIIFNKAICLIKNKKYNEAEDLFQKIISDGNEEKKNEAIMWKILLLIQQNRFEEIDKMLDDTLIKQKVTDKIDNIKQIIKEKKEASYKSPKLACLMSAIIPGSGQIYNNRYKDGIYSFILNALFILGAYKAYADENYALAGILTIFELGWYTGNIYGVVSGAYKYNKKIDEDIFKKGVSKFDLIEYEIGKTPFISIIFKFPF